ncbi:SDR family NAD(P)-dependent oxidoreductase [Enterobacter hormaechei]
MNISSQTGGVTAPHGHVGYSATKVGLIGLTKVLALEWESHSITVNAVSPTAVNSVLINVCCSLTADLQFRQNVRPVPVADATNPQQGCKPLFTSL